VVIDEVRRKAADVATQTMATSPLGVLFVAFAVWHRVALATFAWWLLVFGLTFVLHYGAALVNLRRLRAGNELWPRWRNGFTRVLSGVGWGVAAPILDNGPDDQTTRLLVLLVISLVGVSGGIVIAESTQAVAEFIVGLALPIVVFYAIDGGELRSFVILGAVVMVGLTVGYGGIWNANVYRETEARLISASLAERLERELAVTEESARRFRELSVVVSDMARRDDLTGILNRRGLFEALRRIADEHEQWCVLLIDVDHFKRINDTQGHATGDACLRHLAEVIENTVGDDAVFGRLGGEEFAVALPVVDLDEALASAESIRAAVAGSPPSFAPPITISVGVAERVPGLSDDADDDAVLDATMSQADEALYRAKFAGRNCVRT
jgi:diguanylate cyclase (GGDEF)-like protein